jgi:hypothetical protein
MTTLQAEYKTAYDEWVAAGGIDNNFRAHLLAIGSIPATQADLKFMCAHLATAQQQYQQVADSILPTITRTGRAADISIYTGEINQAFCLHLRELKIDLVIVGVSDLDLARQQIKVLDTNNFYLQVYVWPGNKVIPAFLNQVIELMKEFNITRVWVDVEDSEVNVKQTLEYLVQVKGITTGIYTSAYMWQRWMNNTTRYAQLPLWYARYNQLPDMSEYKPFAGWTTPLMKQYDASNTRYDLNVYNIDSIG